MFVDDNNEDGKQEEEIEFHRVKNVNVDWLERIRLVEAAVICLNYTEQDDGGDPSSGSGTRRASKQYDAPGLLIWA